MYRVLIIDDEPWARKVIQKLVDWDKLDLILIGEAIDGNMGIDMILSMKPDIVITDMRMPGLNGVELLKAIYEVENEIKVIAMSGYSDFAYLKQAIRSEVVEYLLKPVDDEELNEALVKSINQLNHRDNDYISVIEYFDHKQERQSYLNELKKVEEALAGRDRERFVLIINRIAQLIEPKDNEVLYKKVIQQLKTSIESFVAESDYSIEEVNGEETRVMSFEEVNTLGCYVLETLEHKKKIRNVLNLEDVKHYIENYYRYSISLDSIAENFLVTKEHLSRKFKANEKMTVVDYLKKIRMAKAEELMLKHNMPIKEIGTFVGYPDLAYFYRVFKKFYGMAPKEYYEYINKVQK